MGDAEVRGTMANLGNGLTRRLSLLIVHVYDVYSVHRAMQTFWVGKPLPEVPVGRVHGESTE